jgi:hypothetical protein
MKLFSLGFIAGFLSATLLLLYAVRNGLNFPNL